MNLTPEQEAAVLAKYEGFIRNVVNGICSRSTRTHQNEFEDLMQEARIAFLLHLRKAEDISEAHNCGKDILSALWSYWRSMAVVHISKGSYKNEISNVHRIPWEASLDESLCTADNETEFPALLHDFLSG